MAAAAPPNQRWIFGPFSDLVLGCGLGYAVFILFLPWVPVEGGVLAAVGSFATLVIGAPHYGATLLRVYRNREDRRKYAFFTVYLSAFIWLWFVAGLYEIALGSAMITLYLTWSPWHYTGQNYGLAVMFLRRRGVSFDPATKRLLYASFGISYGLVFVSLHRGIELLYQTRGVGEFAGTPFYFIHLGIPLGMWSALFGALLGAYVLATGWVFLRLGRAAERPGDLVPVFALAFAQALWFSVPNVWLWARGADLAQQSVSWLFVWAILGHSIQYLWITTYYAVGHGSRRARWGYWLSVLGAGSAVWALPALVFSPSLLGTHPYSMGLLLMIAAAVNLQHFILDGAIWKLRDSRVSRVLLAPPRTGEAGAIGEERPWIRHLGWGLAVLFIAFSLLGGYEQLRFGLAVQRDDMEEARSAAERLDSIGRGSPGFFALSANAAFASGDREGALRAYQASVDFYPTSAGWLGVGLVSYDLGRIPQAERAYERAIAFDPANAEAQRRYGLVLLATGRAAGAVDALTHARLLRPDDAEIARELDRARAALAREQAP